MAEIIPLRPTAKPPPLTDRDVIKALAALVENTTNTAEAMADTLDPFVSPDALVAVREMIRINRLATAKVRQDIA